MGGIFEEDEKLVSKKKSSPKQAVKKESKKKPVGEKRNLENLVDRLSSSEEDFSSFDERLVKKKNSEDGKITPLIDYVSDDEK